MKAVPKNRRKTDENDDGKDKIIQKLSDKGRNIGLHRVRRLSVRIFPKGAPDRKIQKIIDHGGGKKRNGAAEQNKPRSAEDPVKRRVITRI